MNIDALHKHNMWWAKSDDPRVVPADVFDVKNTPSIAEYPYACSRFPLTVRTDHYQRRASDGLYGGDDLIGAMNSSANESLVLALATGGKFRISPSTSFWRRFSFTRPARYSLGDAMIIASEACSRCMNALAYEYGLNWGYPEGGEEWAQSKTRCVMCEMM